MSDFVKRRAKSDQYQAKNQRMACTWIAGAGFMRQRHI
jgi:hypothetical protein